jgi:hypothetical protein
MAANVSFRIEDQDISLDDLRDTISDEILLRQLERIIKTAQEEIGDVQCPVHGESPQILISLDDGEISVQVASCCQTFTRKTTAPLQSVLQQTAYFTPGQTLIIHVHDTSQSFVFELDTIDTLTIGRSSGSKADSPSIALQGMESVKQGVSRKHAIIRWERGALNLIDNGSANGTYLNDERLAAHKSHVLHGGDTIRLGDLELSVLLVGSSE